MRSFAASILLASSLIAPAAASAASSADNANGASRISTGVVNPVALNVANVAISPEVMKTVADSNPAVVVALKVDKNGNTSEARVVKSVNPSVDAQVLKVVSDLRFSPATLDRQPVAVSMNLTVHLQRAQ